MCTRGGIFPPDVSTRRTSPPARRRRTGSRRRGGYAGESGRLAVGGGWWLVVGGAWQWLAVGSGSPLAVGGWRLVAVGGGWRSVAVSGGGRLALGGPWGQSLRAVRSQKKRGVLKERPALRCSNIHKGGPGGLHCTSARRRHTQAWTPPHTDTWSACTPSHAETPPLAATRFAVRNWVRAQRRGGADHHLSALRVEAAPAVEQPRPLRQQRPMPHRICRPHAHVQPEERRAQRLVHRP